MEEIFTAYYMGDRWGSEETASGPGSTTSYTANIREELPALFRLLGIKRVLDAPCGDFHWFRLVPRDRNLRYVGGDIVEPLVVRNQQHFGDTNTTFIKLDITRDRLPEADIWICRDAFSHFCSADIWRAMGNHLTTGIRYLLTSTHTECERNSNIPTGAFRLLNLQRAPFRLCEPLLLIDDWIPGYPVRKLGLWERTTLAESVRSNWAEGWLHSRRR
jgi:hypothetical protein